MDKATHVFELTGHGNAPYRVVGFSVRKYQACQGAPIQCGASCEHCGTAIMNCFQIQSAAGLTFIVGSDCVRKTGDAGLIAESKSVRRSYIMTEKHKAAIAAGKLRAEARTATRQARREAFVAKYPDVPAVLDQEHHILADLRDSFERWGELSEKQVALALRINAQLHEPKLRAPEGRSRFVGTVISFYEVPRYMAYNGATDTRVVVKVSTPQGSWTASGCYPKVTAEDGGYTFLDVGDEVEMTATIERNGDRAYYKRPTKAVVRKKAKAA